MNPSETEPGKKRSTPSWKQMFENSTATMGIHLTSQQVEQFSIYATELVKWSRRMNLTAIVAPDEIVAKHFMDSLAAFDLFNDRQTVLDMGTGAGFPGLPLKLYRPSLSMVLIDGSRKKVNFVSHLIRLLALNEVRAIQIRSEKLSSDNFHRHAYDVVVSRAVCSLAELIPQTIAFVKPQGRILAWKAARVEQEIAELLSLTEADGLAGGDGTRLAITQKKYDLPGLEEQRSLVIVNLKGMQGHEENKGVQ